MTRRVTLITGAAGDLGGAVAEAMAAQGDALVLVDADSDALDRRAEALAARAGHEVMVRVVDVTDEEAVRHCLAEVDRGFGRLDALFNNAGVNGGTYALLEHPVEDFRRTLEVNVVGVFLVLKHAAPLLLRQEPSFVVNTASIAAHRAVERRGHYAASKAAVTQLTRAASLEFARRGMRINAICPGPLDGALMRRAVQGMSDPEGFMRLMAEGAGVGRLGSMDEVAAFVRYLLTEAPAFLNGASLVIDGCRR